MIPAILKPLLLKNDITWSDFNYPLLYAWLIVIALGILTGLDPQLQQDLPAPLPLLILFGILVMAVAYWMIGLFMNWWAKRKGCDSQGRMFRLVVAVSAIGIIGLLLPVLGLPAWASVPIWLYSVWMAIHTLRQVCGMSIGYALGGIVLSSLLAMLAVIVVGTVFGVVFAIIAPPAAAIL